MDKKKLSRDCKNNTLQIDDVVKIVNRMSPYYDQQGTIMNICKNVLFLWNNSYMLKS